MKKLTLIILTIIIFISLGALYALNNSPSNSNTTNTKQLNLSLHASPSDFKKAIASGKYKLIDVRTIEEYNAGHIQGASQTDFYQTKDFNAYLDSLDKNTNYLIYCHTGNRSGQVIQIMQEEGFKSVSDLSGGINAWTANGFSVVK